MTVKIDMTGQRYGRLLVLGPAANIGGRTAWLCRCECGTESSYNASDLRRGRTKSCGCAKREKVTQRMTTHGHSYHPLWGRWTGMLDRTTNPRSTGFHLYGGRGIAVCERWLTFENFVADMAPTFKPELTLDRIDVNGNYEPGNCRWITNAEQQRNRRSNRTIEWRGTSMVLAEWVECLGLSESTIRSRLKRGWTVDRALTTGVDPDVLARLTTDPAA